MYTLTRGAVTFVNLFSGNHINQEASANLLSYSHVSKNQHVAKCCSFRITPSKPCSRREVGGSSPSHMEMDCEMLPAPLQARKERASWAGGGGQGREGDQSTQWRGSA